MKATLESRLQDATHAGDVAALRLLIGQLDRTKRRGQLNRAIRSAAWDGHLPVVDFLLKAGADPNASGLTGSLLIIAAGFGHLPVVKRLVHAGADIHRVVAGTDAITTAYACGKLGVARYLKSVGANWPNALLLYAAENGKLPQLKEALAAGADIETTKGSEGNTPLMLAARKGHGRVVRHLLKHGANPNRRIKEWTALILAAGYGKSLDTVDALIGAGADVHAKYYDETVLMFAANGGSLPIVKRLIEAGVDVFARDKDHGKTALDYARDGKNKDVIAYLSSLGVTAERDPGRRLAQGLAREYGGRPVEHVHGFMLNAKFAGHKCQFHVDVNATGVVVFKLHYVDAELRRMPSPGLLIGGEKLHVREGRVATAKAASKLLGLLVRHPAAGGERKDFALTFCRRHGDRLRQLSLAGRELVGIASNSARFFWTGTDLQAVLPRLRIFAAFLQEISRAPRPDRRLFEREWLIKPGAKSRAAHSLGGALDRAVACPHCGGATNLMARIDLADRALPKTPLGRGVLPVFWCLTCLEWDPAFFDVSGSAPRPFAPGGRKAKSGKIESGEDDLEEERVQLVPVGPGKKAGGKSKLGGAPTWIQLDATPDCPKCKQPMVFVLQLASDSRIAYSDMGMLYAFACPECRISASLIQSH